MKEFKFKQGDRVRISEAMYGYDGEVGTVMCLSRTDRHPYQVVVDNLGWSKFLEDDLELIEEEKVMKFKVGDKVKVSGSWRGNSGKVGTISRADWGVMYKYRVEFEDADPESFKEEELESVKEEEKVMSKFKVGDNVKVTWSCMGKDGACGIIIEDDGTSCPYKVFFECRVGHKTEWVSERNLELIEEETSVKFKVGDKVKVKDSWFGLTGEVGLIIRIDDPAKYPYRVKFDVVDEEDEELFAEGSLELVKEKQSFTKSDLKTGMGVVLRDGTKGHVLLDTVAGDVIRFINEGSNQWGSVDEYDENMIDCDMSAMDIVEVYSSKYAYCYLTDRVFNQDCVFKREEPKPEPKPEPEPTKMTMKEINEHFGKPIEIVE